MERSFRLLGAVTRPHGVRGEVKVRPETDDPGRFETLESVYLGAEESSLVPYTVRSVAMQPHGADVTILLGLETVSDRDAAERLSGVLVWADEAELPALEEGEFFLGDLVGMEAVDVDGTAIGTRELKYRLAVRYGGGFASCGCTGADPGTLGLLATGLLALRRRRKVSRPG